MSAETGKSRKDAAGEVGAAVEMGFFVAGEGRRFYGHTSTSAVADRWATIRRIGRDTFDIRLRSRPQLGNYAATVE